jgi:hypothetical protein
MEGLVVEGAKAADVTVRGDPWIFTNSSELENGEVTAGAKDILQRALAIGKRREPPLLRQRRLLAHELELSDGRRCCNRDDRCAV